MAQLTQTEFEQSMQLLADAIGLQRLSDKFFKYRGFVTRRGFKSASLLAGHVYTLSAGLRRQVPSNVAFQAIWAEYLSEKVGQEGAEALEKLADAVNECLDEKEQIIAEKDADLGPALEAYRTALATVAGDDFARFDMLIKAVPAIADRLRLPPPEAATPAADSATAAE